MRLGGRLEVVLVMVPAIQPIRIYRIVAQCRRQRHLQRQDRKMRLAPGAKRYRLLKVSDSVLAPDNGQDSLERHSNLLS